MLKQLSQWFLDLSKFVVTAIILTTAISDMGDPQSKYTLAAGAAILTFITGIALSLVDNKRKNKENHNPTKPENKRRRKQ